MDTWKSIFTGFLAVSLIGLALASETDDTPEIPPSPIQFDHAASGFNGRPMNPAESTVVASAIANIANNPPDSITWTDANGNTQTVSCSTYAALLTDQLTSNRMETEVGSRQSGVNHLSDGPSTANDQMNVDSQLIKWAADSGGVWWHYLEETLIHEATHKWQTVTAMSTDEEEADALGIAMESGAAVRSMWQRAVEQLGADSDLTQIIQPMEQRAGVEVRAKK